MELTHTTARRMGRRWLAAALLGMVASVAMGAEPVSKEYQIKAAFLYNFVNFVQWPPQCFADAGSPIVIGVMGTNPFGGELEKAVGGRKISGRRITVSLVQTVAAARQTHLLFVGAGADVGLDELKGTPVLTVGESASFLRQGGIINFVRQNDKLHFGLNMEAAEQAGLKISAQLQKLATETRR